MPIHVKSFTNFVAPSSSVLCDRVDSPQLAAAGWIRCREPGQVPLNWHVTFQRRSTNRDGVTVPDCDGLRVRAGSAGEGNLLLLLVPAHFGRVPYEQEYVAVGQRHRHAVVVNVDGTGATESVGPSRGVAHAQPAGRTR